MLAFEQEAQQTGKPIDAGYLIGRENRLVIVAEVLALIGLWRTDCENAQAAAAVASSALRSAFWLWLEDDDRAMGILRIALESLARLRTWFRNERKATKLQSRMKTTPRDWLDAAGWSRLQSLNLALGELAHTRTNPRWGGARGLLVQVLPPEIDPNSAPQRARGFTLDSIVELGAQVALEAIKSLSSDLHVSLAGLMESTGLLDPKVTRALEDWLSRNWDNRSFDLGPGDFPQPSEAELARMMDELRNKHIARRSDLVGLGNAMQCLTCALRALVGRG
ncbi:MAG TPA: hypothetical protein VJT72_07355 [Pseudonocardiaceae bacterium]|nr:hypothetical protein [Pseudonocardiaceae bacterium]